MANINKCSGHLPSKYKIGDVQKEVEIKYWVVWLWQVDDCVDADTVLDYVCRDWKIASERIWPEACEQVGLENLIIARHDIISELNHN